MNDLSVLLDAAIEAAARQDKDAGDRVVELMRDPAKAAEVVSQAQQLAMLEEAGNPATFRRK